jgi:hypothetical protein
VIILISGKLVKIKPSVIPNLKSNCWLPVFCPYSVYRQTRYNAKIWLDRWWRFNEVILYIDKFKNLIRTSKFKFSFHGVYTGFLGQYNWQWWYYKLFTFLSVDMEILTPWSSQVHPEVQPKCVQATEGC